MKKSLLLGIGALLSVSIWAQSIPDLPIAIGTGSTEVWGNSIYNFVDNIWENAESSPTNVYIGTHGHTIEYLNGFIYLFYNGYTYKYDVSTNTWSQGATNEKGGAWLSSVVYQDEIYPAGWTNGLFYKYSPSSDQWTQLADLPYHVSGGGFDGSHLTLKIFNALGIEVATLVNESKPAGSYEIEFNASALTSGVYFYKLKAGSYTNTKMMNFIR